MKKPEERKGKIIFIDGREELRIDRTNAWLEPHHIKKISETYWNYISIHGFSTIADNSEILKKGGNLSIQLYVKKEGNDRNLGTTELLKEIEEGKRQMDDSFEKLLFQLKSAGIKE